MTPTPPSNPMTRDELLELAALDAMGLLDEYETALYNRSFHLAPPAVQDEVKDVQAAVATNPPLLPDVTPPTDLRQRVLTAVAEAAGSDSLDLAPIAAIGRNVTPTPTRIENAPSRSLTATGQVWRAAAFLLAATLLVGLYFGTQLLETNRDMATAIRDREDSEFLDELIGGTRVASFLADETAYRIAFVAVGDETQPPLAVSAFIAVNEGIGTDASEGCLFLVGFNPDESYRLVARDADGNEAFAREFSPDSELDGELLGALSRTALAAATWEIADVSGRVLLTTLRTA